MHAWQRHVHRRCGRCNALSVAGAPACAHRHRTELPCSSVLGRENGLHEVPPASARLQACVAANCLGATAHTCRAVMHAVHGHEAQPEAQLPNVQRGRKGPGAADARGPRPAHAGEPRRAGSMRRQAGRRGSMALSGVPPMHAPASVTKCAIRLGACCCLVPARIRRLCKRLQVASHIMHCARPCCT